MTAFIKGITYYLPKKVITNDQLVINFPEWTGDKIVEKLGIKKRHIVSTNETALDLAEKAVNLFFNEYKINRSSVDFILLCTQSPDYFLPTSACILQSRIGLPVTCGALDFNLGCSGFVYGLSLAKGLIAGKIANNILVITSETYSLYLHPQDKSNKSIFGDAATVTLISTDGIAEIKNFSLGTDGNGYENLIVKSGALRNPEKTHLLKWDESGNPVSDDYLYMNGTEIFSFIIDVVPKLVDDTLKKNFLKKEDISLYVLHQANKYMLEVLRKKMKISYEQFYYCLENFGNTVSSTIPIALKEAIKESKLHGNILLAGFGVGYSWGGCIIKIHDKSIKNI